MVACFAIRPKTSAAEGGRFQKYEFVTIRWAGRENTHLIRSNGKVEFSKTILNNVSRPDRADERSFYMTIAHERRRQRGLRIRRRDHRRNCHEASNSALNTPDDQRMAYSSTVNLSGRLGGL